MSEYNPRDWYWFIGGVEDTAWSSRQIKYVGKAEIPWGISPTRIPTENDLWEVLARAGAADLVPSRGQDTVKELRLEFIDERGIMKILFDLENRVRTLEGLTALTPQQYKQKVKGVI